MSSEDKPSTGSPVSERWIWLVVLATVVVALIVYVTFERSELYRVNLDWWTSIGRWILER